MNIHHRPIFDTKRVEKHYSKKDGVPVRYVCTSALGSEARAMDIFYRETPHPEFGNRYFGLYYGMTLPFDGAPDGAEALMITNADAIETVEFGMIEMNGKLHYSQHRHDFYSVGNTALDGGRAYFRRVGDISTPAQWFVVKDGEFIEDFK